MKIFTIFQQRLIKKYCELNGYDYTNCLFNENILKNFLDDDFFKIEKSGLKHVYINISIYLMC